MLVDGGYLHFVPVDAATSRGATHLIIVMCSEDTKHDIRPEDWNFFQYLSETSTFSTYGSQTLDYFGREKRMSFLIAPRERRVDKTDFDGRRYKGKYVTLKDFMQEGYEDAQGKENGFRQLSAGEFILN
jgi:predicted acylesterase/phospholipase RssA